tara:strand:- start:140 stop:418 length:279 start_codon:yes stop_codon:yes gene_type:complete
MNIDLTSRGFTPSSDLIELIHSKLEKLNTFDKDISSLKVVLLKESRAEKVELIIKSKKNTYVTKCYSSAFEKTIVMAIDNIKSQIQKNKSHY